MSDLDLRPAITDAALHLRDTGLAESLGEALGRGFARGMAEGQNAIVEQLRFVRQTVHQAHHEGPVASCRKNTCDVVTQMLATLGAVR